MRSSKSGSFKVVIARPFASSTETGMGTRAESTLMTSSSFVLGVAEGDGEGKVLVGT